MKNINVQIPRGSLVAVVGAVGAGKTSLLSALLGEMNKISGRVNTTGNHFSIINVKQNILSYYFKTISVTNILISDRNIKAVGNVLSWKNIENGRIELERDLRIFYRFSSLCK